MKKFIVLILSLFLSFSPLMAINNFCYADDSGDGGGGGGAWTQVSSKDEVVASFKAYCASRHAYINGSENENDLEKALISFQYNNYLELCHILGLSPTGIQAGLWYIIDNNDYLRFMYNDSSLQAYNSMYIKLLQKYDLQPNSEKTLFSGEKFTDDDGNTCLVYVGSGSTISKLGTIYKYYGANLLQDNIFPTTLTFHINNNTYTYNATKSISDSYNGKYITYVYMNNNSYRIYMNGQDRYNIFEHFLGGSAIIKNPDNNKYYLGCYEKYKQTALPSQNIYNQETVVNIVEITNPAVSNATIIGKLGTPTNPFENHEAGKKAIIDVGKKGLSAFNAENDSPVTPTDNVPDDDIPDPPSDSPIIPSIPVGIINNMPINIQLPDLNDLIPDPIPQIPNGFTIPGLRYKFPFCIPFDMIAIYELLDQTPQAPYFETEINFASFNYDLVIDLEEYDPYMVHIRNYFLILYIFGLLFITPKLLKA